MLGVTLASVLYCTFFSVLFLYALILRRKRPKTFPPGPLSLPIIGNLHQLGLEPFKTLMKMGEKYGRVFGIDFASYRAVVINDYKLIRQCFSENTMSARPELRYFAARSGGTTRGLILTSNEAWNEQRAFVVKTLRDFGMGKAHIMEDLIREEVAELIESLKAEVGKPISTHGKFSTAVLNSLWRICAGERFDVNDLKLRKILASFSESLSETKAIGVASFFPTITKIAPEMSGYNKVVHIGDAVVEVVKQAMEEHKESLDQSDNRDLIDAYWAKVLSTSNPHSSFYGKDGEMNMLYSLVDLFLAGSETTSTTLSWAFLLLAVHPDVQAKLYEEIKEILGVSRLPVLNDRQNMPYTECVILEVLRYAALVPLGVFHNTTQDTTIDGYLVPKDTMIVSNLWAALRDPIWGDPDVFRPERFLLPDGTVNRYHEAHIVFSTGKRVCLGEPLARDELFLFMTSLFQHFQVTPNPELPNPSLEHVPGSTVLSPKYHELVLRERV